MVLLDNGGSSSAGVRILAPPEDLAPLVEHLWIQTGGGGSADWRVVADASPHLIFSVTGTDPTAVCRGVVVGARSQAARIDTRERVLTAGIRLAPGALPVLTGAHARAFTDTAVRFEVALPASALADLEFSRDAPPAVVLRDLVRLVRRLAARGTGGFQPLRPVPGGSSRTARERSARHVGLSPVRHRRIARLHRALSLRRGRAVSWAGVAATCGYADQAHLTREFKALLGETPTEWIRRGVADSFKTAHSAPR